MADFVKGFTYVFLGFSWIVKPKIRRFVYIPLMINVVLFSVLMVLLSRYAEAWVIAWIGQKDDWWAIFQWAYDFILPVLKALIYLSLLLVFYFLFSSLANIIAAPFNALLSRAVEKQWLGEAVAYPQMPLAKEIYITIKTEVAKLIRFLVLACLLALLLLVPVVNVFFSVVWFVFMAYVLSLQYIDYPMANHGHAYQRQRQVLKSARMQRLGFGTAANLLLMVPFVNFLAMPVCVCGATIWWVNDLKGKINYIQKD